MDQLPARVAALVRKRATVERVYIGDVQVKRVVADDGDDARCGPLRRTVTPRARLDPIYGPCVTRWERERKGEGEGEGKDPLSRFRWIEREEHQIPI